MGEVTVKSHMVSRLSGSCTSGRNLGEQQQVMMIQEYLEKRIWEVGGATLESSQPRHQVMFQLNLCAVLCHFALP